MHLTSSTMVTHTPSRGANEVGISQAAASSPFLARSLAISGLRVRRLTERERQVALLVAEGHKDAVIARRRRSGHRAAAPEPVPAGRARLPLAPPNMQRAGRDAAG